MTARMLLFAILILETSILPAHLWLERRAEGWAWYEDHRGRDEQTQATRENQAHIEMKNVQRRIEQKLSLAILEPTSENILEYLRLQKFWMDHSSNFSQEWARVVLNHPELDQTRVTPVNQLGIQYQKEKEEKQNRAKLEELGKKYALVFVFKSTDPICSHVAEVLHQFSLDYGWKIVAISQDGKGIRQFPNPELDQGITHHMPIAVTPSLFLIEPQLEQWKGIGSGFLTREEIERNILQQLGER